MATAAITDNAVEIAPGVHWVGALDPHLRSFDIILKTANGTSYNAYVVRGNNGVAIIDTVKENFAEDFSVDWKQWPDTRRSPPSSSTTWNPTTAAPCPSC
jgi:flavorubredoxin